MIRCARENLPKRLYLNINDKKYQYLKEKPPIIEGFPLPSIA